MPKKRPFHCLRNQDHWLAACAILALLGAVGCGDVGPVAQSSPTSNKVESSDDVPSKVVTPVVNENPGIDASELLVGTWLGGAYLDGVKLEAVLGNVPAPSRNEIQTHAQNFLTTVMAIDFRNDGSVIHDIEISPQGGRTIRQGSTGTWRVVEKDNRRIVVETVESLADGQSETSRKVCRLYEDGDHFALQIDLPGPLADCNPLLVFARQETGPTSLAEVPGDSSKK